MNKPNEILVDEILDDSDNSDEYDSSSNSDDSHDIQEQTENENIGHIKLALGLAIILQISSSLKERKSNLSNTYAHPVGICTGPSSFLLAIDILDEETACGRLLEIRLHYPADVKMWQILDGPLTGDLCYLNRVVYICGNRPGKILYYDIQHKVKLQVSKIRSKRELEDNLEMRHLSTIGTMPILRAWLDNHLKQIVKKHPRINHILLSRNIVPTAICGESDFLFCFDDITKCLFQINLSFDGIGVNGNAILLHQMDDVQCVNGIIKSNTKLICTTKGIECGIVAFDLESGAQQTIIAKQGLNGLGLLGESIVVWDEVNHSVSVFNTENNTLKPIAGNGTKGYKDGTNNSSRFSQPFGICTEGNSVFVTDPACGRIAVVSDLFGTRMFLKSLGLLYRAFGIHEKGNKYPKIDLKSTVERVYDAKSFVQEHVQNAKNVQQLHVNVTNGPQGTVSNKTCRSIQILHSGISELTRNVHVLSSGQYRTEASTLLTSIVENLHAVSHLRHQTFSMLEYARDFSTIIRESLKRVSVWSVKYFTHPNSYYPVPNSNMPLSDVFDIKFDLEIKKVSKTDVVAMKSWIENYRPIRQRSVRDETTKDKAGTFTNFFIPESGHSKQTEGILNSE
ncbi:unnamed protein product [Mytilus coruscus]|uniref:Uncharacterized protein n=1 Tax=Mytilus coruscus TaxID=42192 RepID=A0A6J8A3D9_MYTCO|nr:unnamed protein product [Mytilus coruscus]